MELQITKRQLEGSASVLAYVEILGLNPPTHLYIDNDYIGIYGSGIKQTVLLSPSVKDDMKYRYISARSSKDGVLIKKMRIWLIDGEVKSEEVFPDHPEPKKIRKKRR